MTKILKDKDYCYACNSPISENNVWRGFMVQDEKGQTFTINLHYFPPCSTTQLSENWNITAKTFGYPLNYFTRTFRKGKYPNISKQVHEIDEDMAKK